MNKFYGMVGFALQERLDNSITEESIIERPYYGDVRRNSRRYEASADQMLDNLTINNEISILADAYANENFHAMRYVVFMGTKWKITNITVEAPRLLLTIGGVYNGPET